MTRDFNEQTLLLLIATVALVAGYQLGKLDGREDERQRHRCVEVAASHDTLAREAEANRRVLAGAEVGAMQR